MEGFVSGALKLTMDFRGGMSPKHRTAAKLLIPFSTLDNISVEFQRQAIQLFAEVCLLLNISVYIQSMFSVKFSLN